MPYAGYLRLEMLRSGFKKLFSRPLAHSLLKITQGSDGVTRRNATLPDLRQSFFYLLLNDFESSDADFTRSPVSGEIGDVIENSRKDAT